MLRSSLARIAFSVTRHATSRPPRAINRIPLDEPLTEFEKSSPSTSVSETPSPSDPFAAQITTLDTGLKVATQPCHGDFVTIGVAIASGCRYEAEYPKGTAHFLEKLAFASSTRRSSEEIFDALDKWSAIVDCQSTRDTTIYAASCHRSGVSEILELIADAAIRPAILDDEVEAAAQKIAHENMDMRTRIEDIEPLVTDFLHQAAFKNNTLGFSKFTPDSSLPLIKRSDIVNFQRAHHTPRRMVVAGVGVDHDEFVGLSQRSFTANEDIPKGLRPVDESTAQYTGGEIKVSEDLSKVGAGTPYPLLAHVALGFEGVGYKDEDFVVFCVLQSLLGGGNSFSAGGPGKGMYTRLYTDVLNYHHWMYGCQAFNHPYADAGIFAVHASAPPRLIGIALKNIVDQFLRLTDANGVEKEELERAKTQLKSQLLMNLELRPVMFEDIARQVIGHGYRRKPGEYMEKIETVTAKDIVRVGHRILNSRPALVGYGDVSSLNSYEQLDEAIARRDSKLLEPKKKLFSFH